MIEVTTEPSLDALAARLTARAAALAEAQAQALVLARRDDPRRWRVPHLLWPLFTKG